MEANLPGGKEMTVLVLSMTDDASAKEELVNPGADAFLVKPFRYEDLVLMVRDWRKYLPG